MCRTPHGQTAACFYSVYDLAAVGLFITRGNRALFRTLLKAYGYDDSELNEDLTHRLMICTLLHRYSNLPWFMQEAPPPDQTTTLEELADFWFGI